MRWHILWVLPHEFLAKRESPMLSGPPYSHDLAPADFVFPKLKTAIKGTRFKALSLIQHTVMREQKAIWEEAFSTHCMSNVNIVRKRVATILGDGINKYFLSFLCGFLWPQFGHLIVTLCMYTYPILNSFEDRAISPHSSLDLAPNTVLPSRHTVPLPEAYKSV
jgi:hypothetical protein